MAIARAAIASGTLPLTCVIDSARVNITRDVELGRVALELDSLPLPEKQLAGALTQRQREVAELARSGATAPQIALALDIGEATVRAHMKAIYQRFGIRSRVELANILRDDMAGVSTGRTRAPRAGRARFAAEAERRKVL